MAVDRRSVLGAGAGLAALTAGAAAPSSNAGRTSGAIAASGAVSRPLMNLNLGGKTALVTGSTAGIGLAVVRQLAAMGARVCITGRSDERVAAAMQSVRSQQADALLIGVAGDLTTEAARTRLYERVPDVDVLVNSLGGVNAFKPFELLTDEEWLSAFELNVMSGMRMARQYLPGMKVRQWGRIVFVSSESGIQIPSEFIQYGVAKAAEIALARGIAETLVSSGVTVNSVLPGPTRSEAVERAVTARGAAGGDFEREIMQRRGTSLLQRFTTVDEVASMIAYVCSPAASGTHGAALRVEGGIIKSAF